MEKRSRNVNVGIFMNLIKIIVNGKVSVIMIDEEWVIMIQVLWQCMAWFIKEDLVEIWWFFEEML